MSINKTELPTAGVDWGEEIEESEFFVNKFLFSKLVDEN